MGKKMVPCPVCLGTKKVVLDDGSCGDDSFWESDCVACDMSGEITEKESRKIKAEFEIKERKKFSVQSERILP